VTRISHRHKRQTRVHLRPPSYLVPTPSPPRLVTFIFLSKTLSINISEAEYYPYLSGMVPWISRHFNNQAELPQPIPCSCCRHRTIDVSTTTKNHQKKSHLTSHPFPYTNHVLLQLLLVEMQPLPVNPDFEALGEKVPVHRQHGLYHARHVILAVDDQTAHT
jgi:hypothetical protein